MLPKLILPQTVRENARPVQTAAMVLEAALDMHRDGTLDHLLVDRPGAARWLTRIFLQPILGAAGDALPPERAMTIALTWLMEWAITQLRPDRAPTLQIDDRKAWLDSTSWRPMIAAMCHYGFAPVPAFKDRYYRREDESAADNLCGLWNVGPSTYYRYLEKAKRLMARVLYEQRLDGRHFGSLWEYAANKASAQMGFNEVERRRQWHSSQIAYCLREEDTWSAFWHAICAGDQPSAIHILDSFAALFASYPNLEQTMAKIQQNLAPQIRIRFMIALAHVWRIKGDSYTEQVCYEKALQLAVDVQDTLATAVVYSELGRFYEPREPGRAFSLYQESVSFFSKTTGAEDFSTQIISIYWNVADEYVAVLTRLGWLYALRNDPRAEMVLQTAESIRAHNSIQDATSAMLEQALGELWRRKDGFTKALEHKYRALNLYERLNDKSGIAKTYINLGLIYENTKSYDLAVSYYLRVLEGDLQVFIDADALTKTLSNLGACYFWQKNYPLAIKYYQASLINAHEAGLEWHIGTAHYNLAEAYYSRFVTSRAVEDEIAGDEHTAKAFEATQAHYPVHAESALRLKARILSGEAGTTVDQIVPSERAVHPVELSKIDQLLAKMTDANSPDEHADLHMQVAGEYLALALKERETAMKWVQQGEQRDVIDRHLQVFQREINKLVKHTDRLAETWQHSIGLSQEAAKSVIDQLTQDGFLTKSSYAAACGVSLATASKHLGLLTERGLLMQTGKGPATKYVLPTSSF